MVRKHPVISAAWPGVWAALRMLLLCVMMQLASFSKGDIVIRAGGEANFWIHCWANDAVNQKGYGSWYMSSAGMNHLDFQVSHIGSQVVIHCHFILDRPGCGQIYQEFPIFPQSMAMINCAPFDCLWSVLPDGFYYTALTGQPIRKFEWLCASPAHDFLHSDPFP